VDNNFKDSVKARLWDYKYTPFLSAYIFSWIYWNSKLILIFTSTKLSVEKKIEMLSWGDVNYHYPLYFALLYVFIFPLATALFYAVTLWYKALMNWIQQKIQDKTPLPQEQANKIIKENVRLELEHNKIVEELEKIKQDYSIKETALTNQFTEKEKTFDNRVEQTVSVKMEEMTAEVERANSKIAEITTELGKKNETIQTLNSEKQKLNEQINELRPITEEVPLIDKAYKKAQNSVNSLLKELTIDQIKLLATFFMNDSIMFETQFKDYIHKNYKLSKTLIDAKISELPTLIIKEKGRYIISPQGAKILEELFVET